MRDLPPRMEVCPYCKKPFKRLKSHLPYCKMREPTISADQKVYPSKPATLPRAKKMKGPTKDLIQTKGRELETESEERNTKLTRDKSEQLLLSSLSAVGPEKANTAKDQSHLSLTVPKHTEPKTASQGETKARLDASDNTSAERELAQDRLESERSRCDPSEMEAALLVGPVELSLSNQDRKYSSALPDEVRATSVNLKSGTIDPQGQGLPVKLIDVSMADNHCSPRNLSKGVQRLRVSMWSKERHSRERGCLPGASADAGDTETLEKKSASPTVGLHVSPLGEIQVKENQGKGLGLGVEACGSKGNAEGSGSATEVQEQASVSHGSEHFNTGASASEGKLEDAGPFPILFTPQEVAYSEFLSASKSDNQSLVSLAIKSLQEEKAQFCNHQQVPGVKLLAEIEARILEPRSGCGPPALYTGFPQSLHAAQHPFSKSSLISYFGTAERKRPPSSVGLEWFPELYPGYLGLGVLPGKPQYWNSVAQKPQLSSPQGESVSQGWIRCNTTVKKSGIGGITMLFTGYFILCCSWSFQHLTLAGASLSEPQRPAGRAEQELRKVTLSLLQADQSRHILHGSHSMPRLKVRMQLAEHL
ncbi:mitochondrial nucleoid-associated protein 1 isoform X2 [Ictidomys tridecemlineatus]